MYQMSTLETGEISKSVNTAKRVVDRFRCILCHDFNSLAMFRTNVCCEEVGSFLIIVNVEDRTMW